MPAMLTNCLRKYCVPLAGVVTLPSVTGVQPLSEKLMANQSEAMEDVVENILNS